MTMTMLILLALVATVAKLWNDVGGLRRRIRALELSDAAKAFEVAVTVPVAHQEPLSSLHMPAPLPAPAPFAPARVVRARVTPAAAPEIAGPPHPGLEPESHFSSGIDDSATPGRTQGDEERAPPAEVEPRPVSPAPRHGLSFEDIFGRKLPIWAGGITLAVCGFLIVKYSIDAGLLSPLVRIIGGLLFGSGLIAGAEAARQNADRVRDPRVAQALSGAGIATLYASVLVATNVYHLVPPVVAFVGLALITVLAGFLSIRFGAPSALLGLVGGLAAPALVGTGTPNVPLLAAYVSLAVGGLATLGRAQRWWWLGVAALIGGFGWGLVLLVSGALSLADSLSIGAFLLLLGVGLPVLLFGGARGTMVRFAGTLAAAAQLAALVATGGFTLLHWGLFGLLGIAAVWLSRRERALADLPAPALVIALLLLGAWPDPSARSLALVFGGAVVIFGVPAAWRTWRADGRLSDAGAVCALAFAPLTLALLHLDPSEATAALLALLGAAAAAAVAAMGWRHAERRADVRFVWLTGTAAVLLATAAAFGLPAWATAPIWALLAAGLLLIAQRAGDPRVERLGWAAGAATVTLLVLDTGATGALAWAAGMPIEQPVWRTALTWGVPALATLVLARRGRIPFAAPIADAIAMLLGYVALAALVPQAWLPLMPALAIAALGWWRRSDTATATAGVLAAGWAAWPLATWLAGTGGAVLGFPLYVTALPTLTETATRLLAPSIAAAVVLWRRSPPDKALRFGWIAGLVSLGGAAVHIAWKHLFAIDDAAEFIRIGLAERTVWQVLIAGAAVLAYRHMRSLGRAIGLAALAHFAWFTLLLHNPLWSEQAVGAAPVLNLLLPAYALGFAVLWAAGRLQPPLPGWAMRAREGGQMLLILLLAASELRQLIHGSILMRGDVGQAEDIVRSIVAIAIAVGFLQWGIRHRARDWRIASLVVMLGAVLKVFLFDVSGLDGLLRIASFAALGFSLIGIGWLYSRYLPDDGGATPLPEKVGAPTQAGPQSGARA